MAYTTINKSSNYFTSKLYTGNGSSQTTTGLNFQPDLTWIKVRDDTESHGLKLEMTQNHMDGMMQ